MDTIKLTIDGVAVEVPKGTNILDAAKIAGIEIPSLCYMKMHKLGVENRPGSCRVCVVEVVGQKNLAPACVTAAAEGMVVKTCSPRVLNSRKTVVELMLSDHPKDCLTCQKSGHCELQALAEKVGVREIYGESFGAQSQHKKEVSTSIVRDMDKCVKCRRCETMCNKVQTVGALSAVERGFDMSIAPAFDMDIQKSPCVNCGQCVAVCPVGALIEKDDIQDVLNAIADPTKTVVVQPAPAVRVALGEEFGMKPGTDVTGKMVSALRRLGFSKVFDTDWAADLTIMEEGTELLGRLEKFLKGDKDVKLPIFTSCCPAWVRFFETNFPDMLDYPSTARSPQQMFGAIAKTYMAEKLGVARKDMVVVSIMPCVAKKSECKRPELGENGDPDVDFSLTTRELARLIKLANIDFNTLEDGEFDRQMGESTGAAVIFGATGGVMEAALRSAYELHTGKTLEKLDFTACRGLEGVKTAEIDIDGVKLNIAVAHTLGNARKVVEGIKAGKYNFHAVEVMACPGGCVGGAGQPYHHRDESVVEARLNSLYNIDANKPLRKSHENPEIISIYKEFLGKPCGEKSHHLLHTFYTATPKK